MNKHSSSRSNAAEDELAKKGLETDVEESEPIMVTNGQEPVSRTYTRLQKLILATPGETLRFVGRLGKHSKRSTNVYPENILG